MTNPVNAGADIEKAESLVLDELNVSWKRQNSTLTVFLYEPTFKVETLSPASPEYTAHCAMDKAWAYLVKLRAALLAEAGERAKLEAERDAREQESREAHSLFQAEAERARGLEAQLETVRDIAAKMKHVLTTSRELSGWFEIIKQYGRLAALSQLPKATP